MTDLVIVSLEAWDSVWRRNQHLTTGLLRADPTLRVLFIEPATDPVHAVFSTARPRRGRSLRRGPSLVGVGADQLWLHEPTKWLPRRLDRHADARLAASAEGAARRLGFNAPVLWVNDPSGANLLARTGWRALYDITDDWLAANRPMAEHERLKRDETFLFRHCKEVVVCSPQLAQSKPAARVSLIQNAVDVDAYRVPRPRPTDLPNGPVALYVGTIHTDRMDISLCHSTAQALVGLGHLVLVGPAPVSPADRQRLLDAGTVLMGPKDHNDVPAYLQHADVLVVPHVVDAFTDSLDPIKVYEYRAASRPVVSTPVAGFRELNGTRITIATGDAFVDAVRRGLSKPTHALDDPERDDIPTWAGRVVQMRDVLERVASR